MPARLPAHTEAVDWAIEENDALAYEVVSRRAYELWVARGRPEGQARTIWREAEDQLCAQHASRHALAHHQVEETLRKEAQRGIQAFLAGAARDATQSVPPGPEER